MVGIEISESAVLRRHGMLVVSIGNQEEPDAVSGKPINQVGRNKILFSEVGRMSQLFDLSVD
jgi:hypothetical protein